MFCVRYVFEGIIDRCTFRTNLLSHDGITHRYIASHICYGQFHTGSLGGIDFAGRNDNRISVSRRISGNCKYGVVQYGGCDGG